MATNTVFSPLKPAEVWVNAATVQSGTPVVSVSGQPGVTSTASGDSLSSTDIGPYTISGFPNGGVGLEGKEVSVYVDGTFELAVAGAPTTTVQNTLVYATVVAGAVTGLTLTEDDIVFGKVNYPKGYDRAVGILPIQIGNV